MSQVGEEKILSEDKEEEQIDAGDRLVPVSEAIRYRKRAQSAEKKLTDLTEQVGELEEQNGNMSKQLEEIRSEQKLVSILNTAGVVDLEAGVLLVKAKLAEDEDLELEDVIGQLKKQKQYLFSDSGPRVVTKKTSGVRDKVSRNETVLEQAAKQASTSGARTDLQEYLKMRRNFL